MFVLLPGYALATITPEIVPAESGTFRGANEPIRINFPPDISNEVYQQLALELDAIDISGFVSFEGDQLVYQPVQPLQFGPHELRLVQYLDDGSIEEVALWAFEVRQSKSFRQLGYSLNSTIKATHRAAEDIETDNGESIDHENGFQGGATLNFLGVNENYSASFRSNILADHQSDNTPRGEEVDLGNYLFELDAFNIRTNNGAHRPAVRLKVGHHSVDYNSLTHAGFNRRGISGDIAIPFMHSTVKAFSMRASDVTGFEHGLGVSDSKNLVNGFVWEVAPFVSRGNASNIKISYLTGERDQEGFNIGGLAESNAGDAGSVSGELYLNENTVRVYGEYSQSNYDFDGQGVGFSKEKDNAFHSFITYLPQSSSVNLYLGVEKLVVGPNFRSIANSYQTTDKDMTRVFTELRRGPWKGSASFAYEENNLDNDFEATGIGRYGNLSVDYVRHKPHSDSGLLGWLGIPAYSLSYQYAGNNQAGLEVPLIDIDLDMDGIDDVDIIKTDLTEQSVILSTNFYSNNSKIYKGFSASVSWAEFQDHAERFSDSQTVGLDLGANLKFGKLSVNPSVEANTTHERDTNFDSTNLTYNLGLSGVIINNKLSGGLNLSFTDFDDEDDTINIRNNETLTVRGNVIWNVLKADGLLPGIDLRLTGSYQDFNDDVISADSADEYQVFLNVDVNWGIRKPSSFY